MSKPDFMAMSKSELKRYLLDHRNDTEAFRVLMNKINAEPNQKFYTVDEAYRLEELIEAKRQSQDNS
ncbi:MAG: hypothetical protein KME49_30105 [Brasilonema octagenarum HA4186-MV1]|jgi:hypothetical protein|uniref:Uncharacterized protein n=2 Tax=Brasilonema TaxID=383614 RepID=A0A856MHB5_9CYAN|nr:MULTISPECIES: hypothetical protein [Brasilonema]MBW4629649.1 hypothetical protein [Brasilonema octagenarum HA4186-MV1]NMF67343.1 hypothetical protein [Brasilonema octagenarum UFV-OR1]QDL09634.1 hypothetical protein DP114_18595 [Brasilonema sennae CENA114]QDL15989.1 hypothetical protein DP113_18525 [Brasilonema octagenarum UFV-E1]